ncbi:hypothetical protein [Sphingobacterium multivorum]|uniref:hypothetical protein n=1 Tax=Sphingobacterium multivorum TaxID=28454 RepID=UPI000DDB1DD2|nr:hypothetical protein [Sphingobacterium multivorum]
MESNHQFVQCTGTNKLYGEDRFILKNNIGLWDVCAEASRPGSMDLAIQNEVPNPIDDLLQTFPTSHKLFLTTKSVQFVFKAFQQTRRHYVQMLTQHKSGQCEKVISKI